MSAAPEEEVRQLVRDALDRALGAPTPAARSATPAPGAPPAAPERRVAIGADHGGYPLKQLLIRALEDELALQVVDCGTHSTDAVDYPDFAAAVGREVASGRCARGIVIDGAGIGSSMAANKIAGVRCALCHDDRTALNAREHNDANVLALGAGIVNRGLATRIARLFLTTPFGGGRHERRVQKIMALESALRADQRPGGAPAGRGGGA
ncbi:MAG: ribose 5-phosphate isomerase B [Candidatus Eisenbacteria bacterium]|uniref:Ribose 5-phosphate isomerase B n=1 Tax=Eiseniibacteriota bacterium TaxID=2212470 RepID=A0A849SRX8_UNCEI|nr:ribose 5-phosphate isomerase B [Candidatus Eisenbacteria bacterium]